MVFPFVRCFVNMWLWICYTVANISWSIYYGQYIYWTIYLEQYVMDNMPWIIYHGQYTMDNTPWAIYNGQYTMDSIQWTIHHGQYTMDNTIYSINYAHFYLFIITWRFFKNWEDSIKMMSKLRTYIKFKTVFKVEPCFIIYEQTM